ncbi:Imm50 family immunity protein [Streptomyces sp. NPDC001606]
MHNPAGITTVYQGDPPDLIDVHLHEIVLHEDDPTLKLRLDLPRYPEQPPRKWVEQGFNTLQVEISFGGVREIALEGFGTAILADISLTGEEGISLNVMSAKSRIQGIADTAFISKLTAYATEP